jgi:alkylation response protein AidB-like acyl-CoA dehydrogenase
MTGGLTEQLLDQLFNHIVSVCCDTVLNGIYCRFGSTELKKEFLLPSIMGDKVACLGVSEVGAGSDVASTLPSFSIPPVFYYSLTSSHP